MSAVASSVINKSGRKLVPRKPPVRKAARAHYSQSTPPAQPTQLQPHLIPSIEESQNNVASSAEESAPRVSSSPASAQNAAIQIPESAITHPEPSRLHPSAPRLSPSATNSPTDPLVNPPRSASAIGTNVSNNHGIRNEQQASTGPAGGRTEVRSTRRSQRLLSNTRESADASESAPREPHPKKRRLNSRTSVHPEQQDTLSNGGNATPDPSQAISLTEREGSASNEPILSPTAVDDVSGRSKSSTHAQAAPNGVQSSNSVPEKAQRSKQRRRGNTKSRKAASEGEDASVTRGGRSRSSQGGKRMSTPDDAEEFKLETSKATMSELCKDSRRGKKSKRESLLQNVDWDEVKRRQQEEREKDNNHESQAPIERIASPQMLGPQMRVVNDEFVLDETTQVIDEHARIVEEANVEGDPLDESNLTKRVNQSTIGRQNTTRGMRWDEENTEKFYEGLRMFGTDLLMISNQIFDGLDRDHLKRKYIKEERENPHRLKAALSRSHESHGDNTLQAIRELEYEDPAKVYAELEALEKSLEEEYAKEQEENAGGGRRKKKKKGQDQPDEPAEGSIGEEVGNSASKENRHDAEAWRIAEEATAGRRGKKTTSTRRKNQKDKPADIGTEEILGSIDDMQ
ncbi:MAG: hypothetical protein Q9160_007628 [Pyrenula sp. 1 TL-2023]